MIINDPEFGEVIVRKNPLSKSVRFSVSPSGRLQMSVPQHTSDFLVKRFLKINRDLIKAKIPLSNPDTQRARDAKKKILMKKAKEYLPYRLEYYAKLYGYNYDKCRLSHAATRWGSCSSNRTISLNIGLMQVPEILRDYVILHEETLHSGSYLDGLLYHIQCFYTFKTDLLCQITRNCISHLTIFCPNCSLELPIIRKGLNSSIFSYTERSNLYRMASICLFHLRSRQYC